MAVNNVSGNIPVATAKCRGHDERDGFEGSTL